MGSFFSTNNNFNGGTPFILIARCHVKPDVSLSDYIDAARIADKEVMDTESGMIHHTFDKDPDDSRSFVWSELYKNDDALLFHLENPPLQKFIEQHGEMGDNFSVEIYGTVSEKTKIICDALPFPVKYYDSVLGYSRI